MRFVLFSSQFCVKPQSTGSDDTSATLNPQLEKDFNELHRFDGDSSDRHEPAAGDITNEINKLFCDKNVVVGSISGSTSHIADNNTSEYMNMSHNENSSMPADMIMSNNENNNNTNTNNNNNNNNDSYDDKVNAIKENLNADENSFRDAVKQQHSLQVGSHHISHEYSHLINRY